VALTVTVVLIGVYVALDVVAQLLPPHYSPITQAESDLAVGPYGYVMTLNFVVRGVFSLSFLAGLTASTGIGARSRTGCALLAVWGVGAFVLAASPTDLGTTETTVHGQLHLAVAFLAFVAAAVGELLLSRHFSEEPRLRGIAESARVLSGLGVLALILMFVGVAVPYLAHHASGLLERVFLGFVLLWMLVVALYLRTAGRSTASPFGTGS
jgi:hypothetical membrane protein